MVEFAVNIPTSAGPTEYGVLAFCEEIDWNEQLAFGTSMEDLGFDGLAVPDHLMTGDGATTECLTTLTGLAGATETVYLYPKTINNHLRHAPLLAKSTATLDNVSGGRLKLGMGAGWKADEAEAYGYEWPDAPRRLRELEEALVLIKRLWTEDQVTFDGQFYSLEEAVCKPHPTQSPRPPLMVGGGGEEFTLRIAAKHADSWNYWGPDHVIESKLAVLADHCETYGTAFDAIEKSWFSRCIVRESWDEIEDILEIVPRFRPSDPESLTDGDYEYLVGTPAEVTETIEKFLDLGMEEIVVEFVDFPALTGARLFADEVLPAFS